MVTCETICFKFICSIYTSTCCFVFSLWGVIMLTLLGVFFHIQAVALFEDIPLDHSQFHVLEIDKRRYMYLPHNATDVVTEAYDRAALVSWVAAGIYFGFLVLSTVFMLINAKRMRKTKTS